MSLTQIKASSNDADSPLGLFNGGGGAVQHAESITATTTTGSDNNEPFDAFEPNIKGNNL